MEYRVLTLHQPLAARVARGEPEVLNVPRRPPKSPHGLRLLYAAPVGWHPKYATPEFRENAKHFIADGQAWLDHRRGCFVGAVELAGCATGEECQLRGAVGPYCLILNRPRVFPRPVVLPPPAAGVGLEIHDVSGVIERALAEAMTPLEWWKASQLPAPIEPRRAGGPQWTGD